jgi:hypothetical protein
MANRIQLDAPTKKAIVVGIVVLCACVIGAILIVGRGSGSTGLDAARLRPGAGANGPGWGYGGQRSGGSATPGAPGTQNDGSFQQFRTCLADHGVTLPAPGQGRPAAPSGDLRAAFEACRQYLPDRPFGGNGFRRGDHDGFGPGDDSPGSGSGRSGTQTF